ncbi:MAG: hypothetical protein ACPGJS_21240 [Flammeovirgaceae bacterium]
MASTFTLIAGFSSWQSKNNSTWTPHDMLMDSNKLLQATTDEAIPIQEYTPAEIQLQKELNGREEAIITYSPMNESIDYEGIDLEEITPYTWKWVKFQYIKADGTECKIALRRPNWWIQEHHANRIGQEVVLRLPELAIDGPALVTEILPNYLDTRLWEENRKGDYVSRPITGAFEHIAVTNNYFFEGLSTPVVATPAHPFWSADRQAWIAVGKLKINEAVKAKNQTRKLLQVEENVIQKVFNFEVFREHNYLVTDQQLLAHNECGEKKKSRRKQKDKDQTPTPLPDKQVIPVQDGVDVKHHYGNIGPNGRKEHGPVHFTVTYKGVTYQLFASGKPLKHSKKPPQQVIDVMRRNKSRLDRVAKSIGDWFYHLPDELKRRGSG